jgi:hypothetical protein
MNEEIKKMKDRGWTLTNETANTAAFVRGEGENRVQVLIWSEGGELVFDVFRFGVSHTSGVYYDADDLMREIAKAMSPWRE